MAATPFKLPPVPKEPLGENHPWRDWFTKLQAIASGSVTSNIVVVPGGTITSIDASGGTTGLSFTGGPITTSGTLTLEGTINLSHFAEYAYNAAHAVKAATADEAVHAAKADYATVATTIGGRLKPAKGGSGLYDFYNLGGF